MLCALKYQVNKRTPFVAQYECKRARFVDKIAFSGYNIGEETPYFAIEIDKTAST